MHNKGETHHETGREANKDSYTGGYSDSLLTTFNPGLNIEHVVVQ